MKRKYTEPKLISLGNMIKVTKGGPQQTNTLDANSSGFDASASK